MGIERREHPRVDVSIPVRFKDLGTLQQEMTQNLSRGGCMVVSRVLRPVNARIPISLVHPVSGEAFDLLGEVKRVAPMPNGGWALGIQFVEFTPELKAKVTAFVDALTAQAPASRAAAPATRPLATTKVDEYVAKSAEAEKAGDPDDALRYLDLALALNQENAGVHGRKARLLAEHRKQMNLAWSHAQRAAELEPSSAEYARMAEEYGRAAQAADAAPDAAPGTRAPADEVILPPAAPRASPRGGFLPSASRQWVATGALALAVVAVAGYNLWTFFGGRMAVRNLDAAPYERVVPLEELRLLERRAYGVVTPAWRDLDDRERRVSELAERLRGAGVEQVILTTPDAKVVAVWRNGSSRVY